MKKLASDTRRVLSVAAYNPTAALVITDAGYETSEHQTDYLYVGADYAVTFEGRRIYTVKDLVDSVDACRSQGHDVLVALHPKAELYQACDSAEFTCPALALS